MFGKIHLCTHLNLTFVCWEGFFSFCFVLFLGPHPWHMEVPVLGFESELQLLAYATAVATPDLSCICDLHHSLQHCWILNPLSSARGWTCILMHTIWVHCAEPQWELWCIFVSCLEVHVLRSFSEENYLECSHKFVMSMGGGDFRVSIHFLGLLCFTYFFLLPNFESYINENIYYFHLIKVNIY